MTEQKETLVDIQDSDFQKAQSELKEKIYYA